MKSDVAMGLRMKIRETFMEHHEEISKLDDSCTSNPKSEIVN